MESGILKKQLKQKGQQWVVHNEYYNEENSLYIPVPQNEHRLSKVKSNKEVLVTSQQSSPYSRGENHNDGQSPEIEQSIYSKRSLNSQRMLKKIQNINEDFSKKYNFPKLDQTEIQTDNSSLSKSYLEQQQQMKQNGSKKSIPKIRQTNSKLLPNKRQLQLDFVHKFQMNQLGIASKFMSDPDVKEVFEKFYTCFVSFVRMFHQKAFQKLMTFIQFKNYLKSIFVSDDTSIVQLSKDIGFATLSNRFFHLKLYQSYLNERFTLSEIQQFKKYKLVLKQSQSEKEINDVKEIIGIQKIPSYSDFIRKILLTDIQVLTNSLSECMLKKQNENLLQICGEVQKTKTQIENIEISLIKRFQNRKLLTDKSQIVKQFPVNKIESINGLNHASLIENVSKIEMNYGKLNLISNDSRQVYRNLQNVLIRLSEQRNEILESYKAK